MGVTPVEPLPQEDMEDQIDVEDYSYPEEEEEHGVEPLQIDVPAMESRDKTNKGMDCSIVKYMMLLQGTVHGCIACCPLSVHHLIKAERFALVCELCSDQLSNEKRMHPLGTCGDKTHIKVRQCIIT